MKSMKDKLIESLANIPITSWTVCGIAKILIEDGWMKAEQSANSKERLMCLLRGHSIDTEEDIECVAEMLLDSGISMKG